MKHAIALAFAYLVAINLSGSVSAQPGRALKIEDYYRIRSVGEVQQSPDGKWVVYTVTSRIEDDNTNAIDTFVVTTDGSSAPRRLTHDGRSIAAPRWAGDSTLLYSLNARTDSGVFVGPGGPARIRPDAASFEVDVADAAAAPAAAAALPAGIVSADGRWRAAVRELPRAPQPEVTGTEFEQRHAARFKGRQFDWMRFQSEGQDYPTADPRTRPAAEIVITTADGGDARTITKLGLRAANLTWHPRGSALAFTADDMWQNEQADEQPDIYTVTTQGDVKRITNDGYVWSSLSYSPDGQFLLSERTFGTDMIIEKKLSHGGSDDLIGVGWGGHQPHRGVGSRAQCAPLVGGFEVRVLHRREGRHDPSVPGVGTSGRDGRAGDEGRAASWQPDVRSGDDADRLHGRHLREPRGRVDVEH